MRAHFRFYWLTRAFLIAVSATLAWMILVLHTGRFQHSSGYYSPAVEATLYAVGTVLFLSPFIAALIFLSLLGFNWGKLQDVMRKLITRASA